MLRFIWDSETLCRVIFSIYTQGCLLSRIWRDSHPFDLLLTHSRIKKITITIAQLKKSKITYYFWSVFSVYSWGLITVVWRSRISLKKLYNLLRFYLVNLTIHVLLENHIRKLKRVTFDVDKVQEYVRTSPPPPPKEKWKTA